MNQRSIYYVKWGALALLCLILLSTFFIFKFRANAVSMQENYIKENTSEADKKATQIQEKLTSVYQTLRTMSLLPGVRKIDRYGKRFSEDSKESVQQLYNNAAINVSLSEIYILPQSLNPEKIDPQTGKPEEPIVTFDEFVIAGQKQNQQEKIQLTEELEIEEYRQMQVQLHEFKEKFSRKDYNQSFDVPMHVSQEVITCDNSELTAEDVKSKNDKPRNGYLFTIPIYNLQGEFSGGVSAILRSQVLQKFLDKDNMALVNKKYNFLIKSDQSDELDKSINQFNVGALQKTVIFSAQIPITIGEDSNWQVWAVRPDSDFYNSEEYAGVKKVLRIELFCSVIFSILILVFSWYRQNGNLKHIKDHILSLVEQTQFVQSDMSLLLDIGKDLESKSSQTASSFQNTATALQQISALTKSNTNHVLQARDLVTDSTNLASRGAEDIQRLTQAISELSVGTDQIKEMISIIDDIAFQTNLLALNAAVEAARAGEQGKGFAVVADAVRALSLKSADAAKSIHAILVENLAQIKNSEDMAGLGNVALEKIVSSINGIKTIVDDVSQASNEQLHGVESITKSMLALERLIETNAQTAVQILETSDSVSDKSEKIRTSIEIINKSLIS